MRARWIGRATMLALAAAPGSALGAPPAPPPLDAYGDLPGVERMAIAPGGHRIAVISRIGAQRALLVIDDGQKLLSRAGVGDAKLRWLGWAGDDTVLVNATATVSLGPYFLADKYEMGNVLIVPMGGGMPQFAFARSSSMAHAVFGSYGVRQIGGRWNLMAGGIALTAETGSRTGGVFDGGPAALYALDVASGAARKVANPAGERQWRDWLVDADGRVAATLTLGDGGKWTITNAAMRSLAQGTAPTGDIDLDFLGYDGATLVYSQGDPVGERRWVEVPLAGGDAKPFLPDVRVDRWFVDSINGRLLGYLEAGSEPKPVFFDARLQAAARRIYQAFPKLDVELINWSADFTKVVVHTSGNSDSGTWYWVDVPGKQARAVGYDRLAIPPEAVGPISTVTYKAGDGLDLDGILTLPPGREPKNLPVVMLPHGGPAAYDEAQFDWWAQAFASRGYAVFQPNFRGSTNCDDAFQRAGNGQWGRRMQTDISDGLAELARRGIVDPRRACIVGASYGGYAALAGVTIQHGIYRCAVAVAPVADLELLVGTETYQSGDSTMLARSRREQLGPPSGYDAVSPRQHARQADAPILLIHGKDDTVVPFRQSAAMEDALKSAGKPVEMVVLKEEDHWLSRAATRKQMLSAAVAFVEKHDPAE